MSDVSVKRILIMEDDPGLSHLLQKRLQRQGYDVDLATNGEEGLAMIKTCGYDLLIADYNMPFLGGLDVIRTVAASGSPVPVIMVTGEGNETVAVEAIKLGAADYIVKDVELRFLDLLPSVIHQVLYRQQLLKDRNQMQDRMRESEERYRHLFENNPHPMWVFDRESLAFLAVNDAAVRHYGYSREEFLAMTLKDIRLPEDIPKLLETISQARQGLTTAGVWRHVRKDGTLIDVEIASHPILFGNRQAHFSLITDITARKKIEEEMLKAQKLESLGILAGGLAHDFNNLLTAIIGNIALAKMDAGTGNGIHGRLIEAERAAERARTLTQQLLTFSQGGAPVKKLVSVRDVVRDSALFALHGSKSRVEFSIPADLLPVEADEGQLGQVIHNLMINADQAMQKGGTIRVACTNVTMEEEKSASLSRRHFVRIDVIDKGEGIAKENLEKIFDPYFTTKTTGTGLGLATAYSIVKRHNGHIMVDSRPGVGSTFSLYLPVSDQALRAPAPPAVPPPPGSRRGRILIMDDEAMVRDVAGQILTRLGYTVASAHDGAEAIALYREAREAGKPFDLLIMDLTVPGGMGGRETLAQIRQIDPSVVAIVSSGYSHDPIMAHYADHGFRGVVSKPYTIKTLGETVQKVLADVQSPPPL